MTTRELLTFGSRTECPKCLRDGFSKKYRQREGGEYLAVTCMACEYEWEETTAPPQDRTYQP